MSIRKTSLLLVVSVVLVAVLVSVTAAGVLSSSRTLPSGGMLSQVQVTVNVGVYVDSACGVNATFVDWGILEPGDSVAKMFWVKNLGNVGTSLSLAASGWLPAGAEQWMTMGWNQQGRMLVPNEVVQATLTLTVAPSIDSGVTSFSFDIMITGTG